MATLKQYMTVSEAAKLASRSKPVIRRWITEGWIPDEKVYTVPGRNGAWLIDRTTFHQLMPDLLRTMSERKGGRGHKATDARGNLRGV